MVMDVVGCLMRDESLSLSFLLLLLLLLLLLGWLDLVSRKGTIGAAVSSGCCSAIEHIFIVSHL